MRIDDNDDILINYVLLDPKIQHTTPYPLRIHRSEFEAAAFGLRESIVEAIEKEFKTKGDILNLRLWKPMRRIGTDLVLEPVLRDFDPLIDAYVVPYTHPLELSLDDVFEDPFLVHMVVTIHPKYAGQSNSSEPSPDMEKPPVISTGVWRVNAGRAWNTVKPGERHSTDIATEGDARGGAIVLGAAMLDFTAAASEPFAALTSADNITPTGFRLHLDSWGSSRLFGSEVSWLQHTPHSSLQSGSLDANYAGAADASEVARRVDFAQAYRAPPKVFISLSGLTVGGGGGGHWDVHAFATGVDSRGFTLNIVRSRGAEPLERTQVHWLAFPEYGPPGLEICSGELKAMGAAGGEGSVVFEKAFEQPPEVFVAFSQLRLARSKFVRLRASVADVTSEGMNWKVGVWNDTVLESATVSFLAIQRSTPSTDSA